MQDTEAMFVIGIDFLIYHTTTLYPTSSLQYIRAQLPSS